MTTTRTPQMDPAMFAVRDAIRNMLDDAGDQTTGDARAALITELATGTTPQTPELFAILEARGYTPNDTASWDLTQYAGYERDAFDIDYNTATVRVVISRDDGPAVRVEVMRRRTGTHKGRPVQWHDLLWAVDFRWTPVFAIAATLAAAETMAEGI